MKASVHGVALTLGRVGVGHLCRSLAVEFVIREGMVEALADDGAELHSSPLRGASKKTLGKHGECEQEALVGETVSCFGLLTESGNSMMRLGRSSWIRACVNHMMRAWRLAGVGTGIIYTPISIQTSSRSCRHRVLTTALLNSTMKR